MSTELVSLSTTAAKGYRYRLILSNNLTDPSNDVDISSGECVSDDGIHLLRNTATFTKALDAVWAVGTGNGGLDTGVKAASTTYHKYIMRRASDGLIDFIFSTSATSPSMPSGWTSKKRLGSFITDGSGNIIPGRWKGRRFMFNDVQIPVNDVAISAVGALYALAGPVGIEHTVLCIINPGQHSGVGDLTVSVTSPSMNYQTPANNTTAGAFRGIAGTHNDAAYTFGTATYFEMLTNTAAELKMMRAGTYQGAGSQTTVQMIGWEEIDE